MDFQPYCQIDQILNNSEIVQPDRFYFLTALLEVELLDATIEYEV